MDEPRFKPEFKEEAVRQIAERGYFVAEVSNRLGVSAHSLYNMSLFSRGEGWCASYTTQSDK